MKETLQDLKNRRSVKEYKKCAIGSAELLDAAEKCGDEALADMMDYAADIFSEAF